jgi:hydroxylaminobenzene mutase
MHSNAPPYRSNRLIQLGFVLFLLGLIVGFAIPALSTPRMGLASHIQGIINGIFLIVLGLVWSKFTLSARASTALFGLAVYGAFANWAAGRSMPIAAEGNVGTSMQESIIDALLLSLSLAMIGVCVLALWGLRRSATRRVRSNT